MGEPHDLYKREGAKPYRARASVSANSVLPVQTIILRRTHRTQVRHALGLIFQPIDDPPLGDIAQVQTVGTLAIALGSFEELIAFDPTVLEGNLHKALGIAIENSLMQLAIT